MIRPKMEEARALCDGNTIIPIALELYSDFKTPIEVLRSLKEKSQNCYLLESVEGGEKWGRYSFLGYDPKKIISCKNCLVNVEDCENPLKNYQLSVCLKSMSKTLENNGNSKQNKDSFLHQESGFSLNIQQEKQRTVPVQTQRDVTVQTDAQKIENLPHETRATEDIENRPREKMTPNDVLRGIMKNYISPKIEYMPPFTGGLVGYISYDYIKYIEISLHLENTNDQDMNDFELMLFDKVIVFDHLKQKIVLIQNISVADFENSYINGVISLKETESLIKSERPRAKYHCRLLSEFKPMFSKEEYCQMVLKVKDHIHEGDIFQAVISNRQSADFKGDLLSVYRALRTINPSPYMFYMNFKNLQIAGASPETLISLNSGELTTFPIAGTCKRGKTRIEDEANIKALLENEKELAEHNMLVDLSRNDLGKISEFGSVKVIDYQKILKFSHVSHISSTVTGILKSGLDQFDALSAVLPAGTLSGAPKIRACEIINDLEKHKRGIYGGGIGYIDFSGNMDLCIAIRMAVAKNNKIYVQAGAGIVSDSVPEQEYEECCNKARAMINAIAMSNFENSPKLGR